MRHRLAGLLSALLVLGALALPAAGPASAAAAAAPPGPAIASLPFLSEGGANAGTSAGGPGSPWLNAAVSSACNDGKELGSPQWFTLPTGDLGSIYALGRAIYQPRGMEFLRSTVAFVDYETGEVLRCGSEPVHVSAERSAAVVLFMDPGGLQSCRDNSYCGDPRVTLHVARGGERPTNDTIAQARNITSLPFTDTADSTFADDDGPYMFDMSCSLSTILPDQQATVWWSHTATASGTLPVSVEVETYGSPAHKPVFSASVGLLERTPTGLVPVRRAKDARGCPVGPLMVESGKSYLVGVTLVRDSYYGGPLVQGGRFRLHLGAAEAPSVPVGLQAADAAAGSVALTWGAPSTPGSAPVQGYELTRDGTAADGSGPATVRLPADARSHTVSGLRPGVTYRFSVRAVSAAGTGVPATTTHTASLPGRPQSGSGAAQDLATRSATVAWQPPTSDGGLPITGYRVSRTGIDDGGGGPWSTVVPATTRTFTFTQLRPAVRYTLSVEAVNAAGAGPALTSSATLGWYAGYPTNVEVTSDPETRSATLSWSRPTDDGGLPITGYLVGRNGTDDGGAGPWSTIVPATARSQTFTQLLLDTSYTLTVRAITDAGPGQVSSRFTRLTSTQDAGYAPLDPKRVLDTRTGLGATRAKLGPGGTLTLQVTGGAGSGLAPYTSTAVALNVTAIGATETGYISVYPTGSAAGPGSSNLNVVAGQTVPNLVISKLAYDGTVTLYNSAGTVDLVADLQGAFQPDPATITSSYLPMDPQRLLDTRTGLGSGTAAKIGPGGTLRLQVTGPGRAPVGTTAAVLNVTATNPTATGYVSVYPTGFAAGPGSSNLNVEPGDTAPNLVVSKVAADGSVTLYNSSGSVDLIADLQGVFVAGTGGHSYRATSPRRVLDTRDGLGVPSAGAVGPGGTVTLQVTGAPGTGLAPIGSTAVVLNVTATNPTAAGYVSVYPTGFAAGPNSSNLNVVPGRTTPNLVISKVAADGTVTLYNHNGTVDLIADLQGSYSSSAPSTTPTDKAANTPV